MASHPERIGPYPIERELGRGGMGVVYLGRDPELGRPVAVKVLPEALASDPERLSRFDREARMLAAVHHPNVASIFGVGEDAGGRRYLALEYVPGESLAERLARAPLPIAEAIAVCRDVAAGLEAAHEAGVVHRDLKPANVRLTPDGAAKVLDFGLAKGAAAPSSLSSSFNESPTQTLLHATTEQGVVLGTLTYMSPEQASGKPVDRRTDVWALGCILFECLTGRAPFAGNTASDAVVKILEREPPWETLPATTPPRVRDLLARCLEKDRNRRLRDAGDARLELEAAQRERASATAATATVLAREQRRPWKRAALAGITVALAAGALGAWLARGPLARRQPLTHLAVTIPPELVIEVAALAPSGREMVFVGRPRGTSYVESKLYRRAFGAAELVPIPGTERALNRIRFAPRDRVLFMASKPGADTTWEAFLVPLDGSAPPARLFPLQSDWRDVVPLPDGSFLVLAGRGDAIFGIEPDGKRRPTVPIDIGFTAVFASHHVALDGGRYLLMSFGRSTEQGYVEGSASVDTTTGKATVVLENGNARALTRDGTLLFTRGATLLAAPFDARSRRVIGADVSLLTGVRVDEAGSGGMFQLANGTLAFPPGGDVSTGRQLVACVPEGTCKEWSPLRRRLRQNRSIARDGEALLTMVTNARENYEIWRFGSDGSEQPVVAIPGRDVGGGIRSPDGTRVAYFLEEAGRSDDGVWVTSPDRGPPLRLLGGEGGRRPFPIAWLPDGKRILVRSRPRAGGPADILLVDLRTPGRSKPLLATPLDEDVLALSPDGRRVAYAADTTGRLEIYLAELRPDDSLGAPLPLSRGEAFSGAFAPDGRTFYFSDGTRVLRARLGADGLPTGESPGPVLDLIGERLFPGFAVLSDGRLVFIRAGRGEESMTSTDVVLGFEDEVGRRMWQAQRH